MVFLTHLWMPALAPLMALTMRMSLHDTLGIISNTRKRMRLRPVQVAGLTPPPLSGAGPLEGVRLSRSVEEHYGPLRGRFGVRLERRDMTGLKLKCGSGVFFLSPLFSGPSDSPLSLPGQSSAPSADILNGPLAIPSS